MTDNPASYRLEPRDGAGVLLGLELVPCLILGSGLLVAAGAVTAGAPVAVAIAVGAIATGVCFGRVHALGLWEWAALGARWAWTRRRRNWQAPVWHDLGHGAVVAPPCLAGVSLRLLTTTHGPIGAIANCEQDSLTILLPVTGGEFLLRDDADQAYLLARWGDVLAQFATEHSGIAHISWSDLARPSGLDAHRHWLDTQPSPPPPTPAAISYQDLLGDAPARAMSHDIVITLTVDHRHLGTARRTSGTVTARLERAALTALDVLTRSLHAAGLQPHQPLRRDQIADLLRTHIDPFAGAAIHPTARPASMRVERRGHLPMALQSGWDHLRVDNTVQRTWWISDWPRQPVGPAWLEPFLSVGGITRTVTVVLAPIPAHQSRRRIERDLIKLDSDGTTKQDKGRRIDARHRRATDAVLDREEQIVAGHPEIAYLGLVTLAAPDLDTLNTHSDLLEQEARASGLDVRVLYARQDTAWAAALPIGLAPQATVVG